MYGNPQVNPYQAPTVVPQIAQVQTPQMQNQNMQSDMTWVQGIEGAKAWQLNPNSMIILLDSEVEGKMYIKVSDNIGMSTLRIFNYVEETSSANVTTNNDLDLSAFVRKDELSALIKEIMVNEQSVSTATGNSTTTESAAKPKIKYLNQ